MRTEHQRPLRHVRPAFAFVALVAVALLGPLAATAAELKLGATVWPPFSDEPGESRVAIALVQEALHRIGYESSTALVDDGALTPALLEGRYDGSPALWRTAEREAYLRFSTPLLENRLVLVGRKGADVSQRMLADLDGARVGIVEGFAYGEAVSGVEGPEFVVGRDPHHNLERLLAGDVDYILVDELLIQYALQHQAAEAAEHLAIGSVPMVKRTLHFAVRKDVERSEQIVSQFDDELNKMLTDGTYHRLLGLFWIHADVDGDGQLELVLGTEHAGTEPPTSGYKVHATETAGAGGFELGDSQRYWIDGAVFQGWGEVPERYKAYDPTWPDPENRMGTVFRFNFGGS